MYSTVENGIYKTEIPIAKLCQAGEPVARSQARRICNRLDSFSEVVLNFEDIVFCGQGFADEMFRVYKNEHPGVIFTIVNANEDVLKMIRHVGYSL